MTETEGHAIDVSRCSARAAHNWGRNAPSVVETELRYSWSFTKTNALFPVLTIFTKTRVEYALAARVLTVVLAQAGPARPATLVTLYLKMEAAGSRVRIITSQKTEYAGDVRTTACDALIANYASSVWPLKRYFWMAPVETVCWKTDSMKQLRLVTDATVNVRFAKKDREATV